MKKEILITGGTGSLGKTLLNILSQDIENIKGIRIYSRDELKQHNLRIQMKDSKVPIAYIIGDIRDYERIKEAMQGVNIVIHTAALKQVPTAEDNPLEFIRTNIYGTENVLRACNANCVEKATLISTDKSAEPINLYGATKLAAEKIWLRGHVYNAGRTTKFVAIRYGNVIGSRGSIIDLVNNLKNGEKIPITDPQMTRFWIKLPKVAQFILSVLKHEVISGQVYIPKMMSCHLDTFMKASTGTTEKDWQIVGIRNGEKIDEQLINREEINRTIVRDDCYVIWPYNTAICGNTIADILYSDYRNPFFEININRVKKFLEGNQNGKK